MLQHALPGEANQQDFDVHLTDLLTMWSNHIGNFPLFDDDEGFASDDDCPSEANEALLLDAHLCVPLIGDGV